VTGTRFDLIVFDFDDTLVKSAGVKRRAFFEIFPPSCEATVGAVLARDPDGSRHAVIPAMLAEAAACGVDTYGLSAEPLIHAYGERVAAGVGIAAEIPLAADALRWASEYASAYIFSMTPHEELLGHIVGRGWEKWIAQAYGFPSRKPEVLKMLLERHHCAPERALVIGDGISDAEAARIAECRYLAAEPSWPLKLMQGLVDGND